MYYPTDEMINIINNMNTNETQAYKQGLQLFYRKAIAKSFTDPELRVRASVLERTHNREFMKYVREVWDSHIKYYVLNDKYFKRYKNHE